MKDFIIGSFGALIVITVFGVIGFTLGAGWFCYSLITIASLGIIFGSAFDKQYTLSGVVFVVYILLSCFVGYGNFVMQPKIDAQNEKKEQDIRNHLAQEHANKILRIKSGECSVFEPTRETHFTGGKYPKAIHSDFIVYTCKNGDVFKLPLN